jgi:hypothetical protein
VSPERDGLKQCRICLEQRPLAEFHGRGNGVKRAQCRDCRRRARDRLNTPEKRRANCARTKAWREANPERARQAKREYHQKNRDRIRAYYRLRDTGWTPAAFDAAWSAQDGRCAVCSTAMVLEWKKPNSVAADHCHRTGKPRELLCSACNRALGLFGDDTDRLMRAVAFLERHR